MPRSKPVEIGGTQYPTQRAAARALGVSDQTISNRLNPDDSKARQRDTKRRYRQRHSIYMPITSKPMQAALRRVAERHGYTAARGPHAGEGNPSEFILALDAGEVATVLLADEERGHAIRLLLASDDDVLRNIGAQLQTATAREQATSDDEIAEYLEARGGAIVIGQRIETKEAL